MAETVSRSGAPAALRKALDQRTARVAVVGLGYVGLPLACRLAERGFAVAGVERDRLRLEQLRAGRSFLPDLPDDSVRRIAEDRRHVLGPDAFLAADCDVVVLCLPTPLGADGLPDLEPLRSGIRAVIPALRRNALVVLESTLHPGGTASELVEPLRSAGRTPGEDVFAAYSPERVNPGDASVDPFAVPKLVAGATPRCRELAEAFYKTIFHSVVPVSSPAVAEMAKLLENTFRSVNIGLVNELKQVATSMGVDIWEVVRAASTKPYGFMTFNPGPGLGGHCLPVDPHYLVWAAGRVGVEARLVETAARISAEMPAWVAGRILTALEESGIDPAGSRMLMLGVAYKAGVGDLRGSPALEIARILGERGVQVQYSDPYVPRIAAATWHTGRTAHSRQVDRVLLDSCDCVVLATDHDDFDYRLVREYARLIVDTRGRFPAGPGVVRA